MSGYEMELKNREHGEDLSKSLWKFRKEENFCDVTIVVNKERFPAHKVVLSAHSEYFHTMFTSGFKESTDSEVTIEGDDKIFAKLLKFAYTGMMDVLGEDLPQILAMASYFQFKAAISTCEEYLFICYNPHSIDQDQIQEDPEYYRELLDRPHRVRLVTALEIETQTSAHGLSSITQRNRHYIAEKFQKFSMEPVFDERCPVEVLMYCIQSEARFKKSHCSETHVLQTVIKWLTHSWEDRKEHALNLLTMIRLGVADIAEVRALLNNATMMSMKECKDLIEGVLQLYDTRETAEVALHISHPQIFASRNTISALITIGRIDHKMLFYENRLWYPKSWSPWLKLNNSPQLPCQCQDTHSIVVVNGRLYAAGGNSFFCLDDNGKKWKQLASMNCHVKECHLVELNGYIYAVNSGMDSERYNLKENTWEVLPSRTYSERLTHMSVVAFDGKLLVYGKYDLHAIQVYDPDVNKWYEVTLPPHTNGYERPPILTVHEGALYRVAYDQNGRHPVVNHLQYVPDDQEGAPSIVMAELQEQKGIPDNNLQAFCIGQEVFINVHGRVVKIGQKDGQVSALYSWKSVMALNKRNNSRNLSDFAGKEVAVFTFDVTMLE